jgi:hypothetical protein
LSSDVNLYWDNGNDRLGIGTASPAQKLDVRGFVVSNSQSNGSESAFYLGNSSHGLSRANLGNDIVLYTTSGDVKISGDTATATHLIVKNGGNVGIGTTSPQQRLHISNSSGSFGAEVVLRGSTSTGTPKSEIAFKRFTSGDGATMVLRTSNSSGTIQDALTLDTSRNANFAGNVAVKDGVNFYGANDTAASSENSNYVASFGKSTSGSAKFAGNITVGSGTSTFAGNITVDSASVAQIYLDSAANNDAVLNFQENATQKGKIGYDTSLSGFAFVAGSGAFSTADMVVLDTGNVGIGTTSPDAKLQVDFSTYANTNAVANFINGNNPVRVAYDTVVIAQTDVPSLSIVETIDGTQANEQKLTFAVGDNASIIRTANTSSGLYINVNAPTNTAAYLTGQGTTAMRFLNNGNVIVPTTNVGIGTTSPNVAGFPSSTLTVQGSSGNYGAFELGSASQTSNNGRLGEIRFYNKESANPYGFASIRGLRGSSAGDSHISFFTSSSNTGAEKMRITSGGLVGIGMTPNTAGSSTYMLQMYNPGSQCFLSIGNGTGS